MPSFLPEVLLIGESILPPVLQHIFAGGAPAGLTTTGYDAGQFDLTTDNGWDQPAENVIFGAAGSNTYTLSGGLNYDGGHQS
jgi:hypothetical protein